MTTTTTKLTDVAILLVEDDPDLIRELTDVFVGAGAKLTVKSSMYGNLSGALPVLKDPSFIYRLVILDTILPETDDLWEQAKEKIQKYSQLSSRLREEIERKQFDAEARTRIELAVVRSDYRNCLNGEGALVLLKELHRLNIRVPCPILFLTSRAEAQVREESIRIARAVSNDQPVEYLTKPVTSKLLLDTVLRLVRVRDRCE